MNFFHKQCMIYEFEFRHYMSDTKELTSFFDELPSADVIQSPLKSRFDPILQRKLVAYVMSLRNGEKRDFKMEIGPNPDFGETVDAVCWRLAASGDANKVKQSEQIRAMHVLRKFDLVTLAPYSELERKTENRLGIPTHSWKYDMPHNNTFWSNVDRRVTGYLSVLSDDVESRDNSMIGAQAVIGVLNGVSIKRFEQESVHSVVYALDFPVEINDGS